MMKPEEYAWNEHERQLYIENRITTPSSYKIKMIKPLNFASFLIIVYHFN